MPLRGPLGWHCGTVAECQRCSAFRASPAPQPEGGRELQGSKLGIWCCLCEDHIVVSAPLPAAPNSRPFGRRRQAEGAVHICGGSGGWGSSRGGGDGRRGRHVLLNGGMLQQAVPYRMGRQWHHSSLHRRQFFGRFLCCTLQCHGSAPRRFGASLHCTRSTLREAGPARHAAPDLPPSRSTLLCSGPTGSVPLLQQVTTPVRRRAVRGASEGLARRSCCAANRWCSGRAANRSAGELVNFVHAPLSQAAGLCSPWRSQPLAAAPCSPSSS